MLISTSPICYPPCVIRLKRIWTTSVYSKKKLFSELIRKHLILHRPVNKLTIKKFWKKNELLNWIGILSNQTKLQNNDIQQSGWIRLRDPHAGEGKFWLGYTSESLYNSSGGPKARPKRNEGRPKNEESQQWIWKHVLVNTENCNLEIVGFLEKICRIKIHKI